MRDISSLSENDFKVLEYIRSHGPTTVEDVERALPDVDSVPFRIAQMRGQTYRRSGGAQRTKLNASYLHEKITHVAEEDTETITDFRITYTLTDLGRTALQDYKLTQKSQRRELWFKNAWIPILVTIAAALVIRALEWLFPLIQG